MMKMDQRDVMIYRLTSHMMNDHVFTYYINRNIIKVCDDVTDEGLEVISSMKIS